MPPLFFAVAAASSESSNSGHGSVLALHPGSGGWQSARCCSYPQELLLQLERGAEVHEIEIAAKGELTPRAVDVFFSRGSREECLIGDPLFELAGTLQLSDGRPAAAANGRGGGTAKRVRLKLFALCSGQVRLLVHEPLTTGPGNPFRQVSLASLELWGYEDAMSAARPVRPKVAERFEECGDEVARVLTELGIPLSVVPVDEDLEILVGVDPATKRLIKELQKRQASLVQTCQFGESQQLSEHIQDLAQLGKWLQELVSRRDRFIAARSLKEAEHLGPRIRSLEDKRLQLSALYDTDFFLESMAMGFAVNQPEPSGAADLEEDSGELAVSAHPSDEEAAQQETTVLPEDGEDGEGQAVSSGLLAEDEDEGRIAEKDKEEVPEKEEHTRDQSQIGEQRAGEEEEAEVSAVQDHLVLPEEGQAQMDRQEGQEHAEPHEQEEVMTSVAGANEEGGVQMSALTTEGDAIPTASPGPDSSAVAPPEAAAGVEAADAGTKNAPEAGKGAEGSSLEPRQAAAELFRALAEPAPS
ncbi:unnamed protein product [Polarella glacialis]|uniref:Centrosomal protein CEP104 N-terminal domain-containing protein n=1 Tax=Polarella glacialis TaxID=89957 RepID=A0A813ID77_POLGL|nr:unnamed protein product [Polarella glacialis]CAE8648966.1 unnamed protein product [Polarella glacialis]